MKTRWRIQSSECNQIGRTIKIARLKYPRRRKDCWFSRTSAESDSTLTFCYFGLDKRDYGNSEEKAAHLEMASILPAAGSSASKENPLGGKLAQFQPQERFADRRSHHVTARYTVIMQSPPTGLLFCMYILFMGAQIALTDFILDLLIREIVDLHSISAFCFAWTATFKLCDPLLHIHFRTYFYLNEAQCEKNTTTFLKSIDAVAGATGGTGLAAIKLTALGRPQLLVRVSLTELHMHPCAAHINWDIGINYNRHCTGHSGCLWPG